MSDTPLPARAPDGNIDVSRWPPSPPRRSDVPSPSTRFGSTVVGRRHSAFVVVVCGGGGERDDPRAFCSVSAAAGFSVAYRSRRWRRAHVLSLTCPFNGGAHRPIAVPSRRRRRRQDYTCSASRRPGYPVARTRTVSPSPPLRDTRPTVSRGIDTDRANVGRFSVSNQLPRSRTRGRGTDVGTDRLWREEGATFNCP